MSAWICSKKTFDRIVTYLEDNKEDYYYYYSRYGDANGIGQVLVNENFRSVNKRYESEDTPFEYTYTYTPDSLMQVLKSCHCLEYQSRENDDYQCTDAFNIVYSLINRITMNFVDKLGLRGEYERAEWE